jgi:exoribonuclease II
VLGDFEADFIKELKASNAKVGGAVTSAQPQDTFLAVDGKKSLATIAEYAKKMRGAEALWLVYPKGNKEVTESDVLSAGRKSGLSDVKVVAFSATHTALKFVIPAAKR